MKKIILLAFTGMLFIPTMFLSCNKENTEAKESIVIKEPPIVKDTPVIKPKPDSCATVSSKGRIIGWNPCCHFMNSNKVMGAGFIIEIDNGATRDTVASYNMPDGLFQFLPSYILDSHSNYLFVPDVQDKFKIKFNYRFVPDDEKKYCLCSGSVYTGGFFIATKGKQIVITCISPQ